MYQGFNNTCGNIKKNKPLQQVYNSSESNCEANSNIKTIGSLTQKKPWYSQQMFANNWLAKAGD